MVTTIRLDWIKLYKELQRTARQFPQYSYRHFGRRRIRDYFDYYRNWDKNDLGQERLNQLYEEGQKTLLIIKRQAKISSLYPTRPLVIEQKQQQNDIDRNGG